MVDIFERNAAGPLLLESIQQFAYALAETLETAEPHATDEGRAEATKLVTALHPLLIFICQSKLYCISARNKY